MDRDVARRLVQSGLKGVGVSVDSLDPRKHNRFRGIPKAWENTMAGVEVMRAEGLPFLIETTLTRANVGELSALADFCLKQGATALNAFFLVPTGRGAALGDLSPEEYEEAFGELARLQEIHAGSLLINAKCAPHYRRVLWERNQDSPFVRTFRGGGCPAGTYYCRIGPTGDVTPCPYMPVSAGNVRQQPFGQIWNSSELLARFRTERPGGRCGSCEFTEFCGGCRCRAFAATGDILAEDPSCVYQPGTHGGQTISLATDRFYGATTSIHGETTSPSPLKGESQGGGDAVQWTPEALARLDHVPFFARGIVRNAVESAARSRGLRVITTDLMTELRSSMPARFPSHPKS